jgi:hypothetical protein
VRKIVWPKRDEMTGEWSGDYNIRRSFMISKPIRAIK